VPLYVYPQGTNKIAQWKEVIDAADDVDIIAIVNVDSGPGLPDSPDSTYQTWVQNLLDADITVVGYVHTLYGGASLDDVETNVSAWYSNFPGLSGIFVDEASEKASDISDYYSPLYSYITSFSGYDQVILNPGTEPNSGYLAVSTTIVIFESPESQLAGTTFDSWVTCPSSGSNTNYKYHFGGIAYSSPQSDLTTVLSTFASDGIGLVYATGTGNYNKLATYFTTEVSDLQSLNS